MLYFYTYAEFCINYIYVLNMYVILPISTYLQSSMYSLYLCTYVLLPIHTVHSYIICRINYVCIHV
jgi:hypothetical protein